MSALTTPSGTNPHLTLAFVDQSRGMSDILMPVS